MAINPSSLPGLHAHEANFATQIDGNGKVVFLAKGEVRLKNEPAVSDGAIKEWLGLTQPLGKDFKRSWERFERDLAGTRVIYAFTDTEVLGAPASPEAPKN